MSNYDPANWYWVVGGSTSQVYASARAAYVDVTDTTYEAWLSAGGFPTKIDTDSDLKLVLFQADALSIDLTSTGTPSLNGLYSVSKQSQLNVTETVGYIELNGNFPGGGSTMLWLGSDGTPHTFPNVATFKNFATAFADFVASVVEYIDGNGAAGSVPSTAITIA
jgi:hypothetical protein